MSSLIAFGTELLFKTDPTFTLFPQLPAEIRLKIWAIWSNNPRSVLFKIHLEQNGMFEQYSPGLVCSQRVPAVLHVNREARREALKVYQVSFRFHLLRPTYFNFAVDTIQFFSSSAFFTFSFHQDPAGEKSRVLAIMVPKDPGPRTQFYNLRVSISICGFSRLEKIFLGNISDWTTELQQDAVQGLVAAAGEDLNEEMNKTYYNYRSLAAVRDADNRITNVSDNTIKTLFPKSFRLGLVDDCEMMQAARTGEFDFRAKTKAGEAEITMQFAKDDAPSL